MCTLAETSPLSFICIVFNHLISFGFRPFSTSLRPFHWRLLASSKASDLTSKGDNETSTASSEPKWTGQALPIFPSADEVESMNGRDDPVKSTYEVEKSILAPRESLPLPDEDEELQMAIKESERQARLDSVARARE
jgi:hypothetical protein